MRNLFLDLFVVVVVEEIQESLLKFEGVQALASPGPEVVWNEFIKMFTADKLIKIPQKVKALLIGHSAEGILGIYAFMADNELGKLMVLTQELDRVLYPKMFGSVTDNRCDVLIPLTQCLPANDS